MNDTGSELHSLKEYQKSSVSFVTFQALCREVRGSNLDHEAAIRTEVLAVECRNSTFKWLITSFYHIFPKPPFVIIHIDQLHILF
jgi:hypothetical protein